MQSTLEFLAAHRLVVAGGAVLLVGVVVEAAANTHARAWLAENAPKAAADAKGNLGAALLTAVAIALPFLPIHSSSEDDGYRRYLLTCKARGITPELESMKRFGATLTVIGLLVAIVGIWHS